MNQLLETIEKNGEFEKYIEMLADRQVREQRELKRRNRELERVKQGDEFNSEEDELTPSEESSEIDSNDELSEECEDVIDMEPVSGAPMSGAIVTSNGEVENTPFKLDPKSALLPGKQLGSESSSRRIGEGLARRKNTNVEERFNPLRFLAQTLKQMKQNQQMQ